MICKKCKKEIPDGSTFCNWCGKKQEVTKRTVHRRAKGTGTIRKDARYASPYIALAPAKIKGQQGKYIGAFKTFKEAQEALEKYQHEKFPDLYNATLSKIYELWSAHHFETLQSDNGIGGYTAAYKNLAPLHNRRMRELKTADFQICIDDVAEKFSRSKCEKVKQLCSQLCKYAMQNDVIDKNYAEFIKLPKEKKSEKVVFSNDELRLLWEHTNDNRVKFILFMIYTGFRIGEVSDIQTENINLENGYIIGGLKTDAGKNRVVPLPPAIPEISDFVREWLEGKEKSPFGVPKNSLRQYWFYPVLSELGMIDPPTYNAKTRKKEYKNPRITPHSTRHTFASISAEAGIKPENLQKIIGHADFQTTANIYVHKDYQTLRSDMSKLTKFGGSENLKRR